MVLKNTNWKKEPSESILDVGVLRALDDSGFGGEAFRKRGGKYQWSKATNPLEWERFKRIATQMNKSGKFILIEVVL